MNPKVAPAVPKDADGQESDVQLLLSGEQGKSGVFFTKYFCSLDSRAQSSFGESGDNIDSTAKPKGNGSISDAPALFNKLINPFDVARHPGFDWLPV
jgi:hypothetical protein